MKKECAELRERVEQLEQYMGKIIRKAENQQSYTLDMAKPGDPWVEQIYRLARAALYGDPIEEATPKSGTELTRERLSESLRSLNSDWTKEGREKT